MTVGFFSVFISVVIGSFMGLLAGYRGGIVDMVIMRVVDTFMCIPYLPFVLVLAAALGPGLKNIIVALAVLGWTGFCRIMRGQVLMVRELPYIEAAKAAGASGLRIMLKLPFSRPSRPHYRCGHHIAGFVYHVGKRHGLLRFRCGAPDTQLGQGAEDRLLLP